MSYTVTNSDGVVLALYEDKNDADQYAISVGGFVVEDDGSINESETLVESGPMILAG